MKRVFAVVFLSLLVLQLCLLPMAVTAKCLGVSTVTLPVTNITDSTATLNGTWTSLEPYPSSFLCVSFQYSTVPGVYTSETPQIAMSLSETGTFPFQANISGLSPCTTYYVRTQLHFPCTNVIFNQYGDGLKGAGIGLDYKNLQQLFNDVNCPDYDGNVISFQTTGCLPPPTPPSPINPLIGTGSHGSSGSGTTTTQPVGLPNIVTQSARLSAKSVTPGTPITVTADIANRSAVNGNKKVTLYVNGQVETTQGITVNSGGSAKLTFNVSRSEPGDYTVYVDDIPAGSFKVEVVTGPDSILIFSAVLVALAFLVGMVMLWRRQRAG